MLQASPVYAEYLAGVSKTHTLPVVGIILGVARPHRPDTVVHMVRLFKSEDDDEVEDVESRKDGLVYDIEDVLHMLTPGIEVLGTFVVCSSDDVEKDTEAWDRVKLVYRVVRKLCSTEKHFILGHNASSGISPGKTTCKLVQGDKQNLNKNELKTVSVDFSERDAYKSVQLSAQFSLTRSTFLRSFDWAGGAHGHMKVDRLRDMLCKGLEATINGALITFNGEIPLPQQQVKDVVFGQMDEAGDRSKSPPIVAEIYEKNVPIDENDDVKRSSDLIQLKGCVASRLFVFPDDTLAYVEALLRKDLIQSITQRIHRATDHQEGAGDQDESGDVIALDDLGDRMGRRIYFTIQPSNIQLFDYLYADENEDELRERINAKLDIDVEVTDIYFDLEEDGQGRDDASIDTIGQASGHSTKGGTAELTSQLGGSRKILFLIIRFALVAVVAVVIPLIFAKMNKT